jgi:hypothetical protein
MEAAVERLDVAAYTIPTDRPESDGTLAWDATTIVIVEAHGGGETGLGYTYAPAATASLVAGTLAGVVRGIDALAPPAAWAAMSRAVRNADPHGLSAYAVSAVDVALHDLKERLLGVALADLLGRWHEGVEAYGSGGFTSYTLDELRAQAQQWRAMGARRVKVKVGRDPGADAERLRAVREGTGDGVELMVDANGAFTPAAARPRRTGRMRRSAWATSRSPCPPTIRTGCGGSATAHPQGWRSPRASTPRACSLTRGCSPRRRSTSSRPTSPAAGASPASCAPTRSRRRTACRSPRTARPR